MFFKVPHSKFVFIYCGWERKLDYTSGNVKILVFLYLYKSLVLQSHMVNYQSRLVFDY